MQNISDPKTKKAFLDIMNAMGSGEKAAYNFDITKLSTTGRSKIVAALKVFVAQTQRKKVTESMMKELQKDYAVTMEREGTQLNVLIDPKNNKIIRIDIKPSSAGRGGATKQTSINESAQSVYGALVFDVLKRKIGTDEVINTNDLQKAYDIADVTATFEEVETIMGDWHHSSIAGANALKDKYGNKKFEFHRGSEKVKIIEKAFSKVKKNVGWYGDVNKWSPADIYLMSRGFDPSVLLNENTFAGLNASMYNLLMEEKLIGVSLKKIETPKGSISNINFPDEKNVLNFKYDSMESPVNSTSGYLMVKKNNQMIKINFRTFTRDGGFSGEILGGAARQGKVSHGPINEILKAHGMKEIPTNQESKTIARANNRKDAEYMADVMIKTNIIKTSEKNSVISQIQSGEAIYRQSKYLTMKLFETIHDMPPDKRNEVIEDFYRYAGSQVRNVSAPYIKLQ